MALILAIDLGTSQLKVATLDEAGIIQTLVRRAVPIQRPSAGAAEHDPKVLLDLIISATREAVDGVASSIAAITLASYQFGMLLLDNADAPIGGISTLLDTRARESLSALEWLVPPRELYERTGCPPLFHYPLCRLNHLLRGDESQAERIARVVSVKEFLFWNFTGQWCCDTSTAAASQLMECRRLDWCHDILEIIGLHKVALSKLCDGTKTACPLRADFSAELGLKAGIPVVLGLYDGGALALGLGALGDRCGVINLGTSAMLRTVREAPVWDPSDEMRIQPYHFADGKYLVGGAINNSMVVLRWFGEQFGCAPEQVLEEALQTESAPMPPFFYPYLTGERDPRFGGIASGAWVGLQESDSRGRSCRSAVEGMLFSLSTLDDALRAGGIVNHRFRAGGGGAKSTRLLRLLATILNAPVQPIESEEAGLVGSSLIAWTHLGRFSSLEQASEALVRPRDPIDPDPGLLERYAALRCRWNKVREALIPAFTAYTDVKGRPE